MDFFTADTHFSHGNILKYCKRLRYLDDEELRLFAKEEAENKKGNRAHLFKVSLESIYRMNEDFINTINSMVAPDDTLWHLGDFCFCRRGEEYNIAKRFRDRIACRNINLIWGNHDRREISRAFNEVYDKATVVVNNQLIVMDHYAHAVWEKSHRGSWHIYGHSHSTAEKWLNEMMPNRRSIDVGVDNAIKILGEYRPFSFKDLQKIFAHKTGCSIDHHKEE